MDDPERKRSRPTQRDNAPKAIGRHRLVLAAMIPALPMAFFYSPLAIVWILCWHVFFDVRPFFANRADAKKTQGPSHATSPWATIGRSNGGKRSADKP